MIQKALRTCLKSQLTIEENFNFNFLIYFYETKNAPLIMDMTNSLKFNIYSARNMCNATVLFS